MPASRITVEELLTQGLSFHERGMLAEAERTYKEILSLDPDNFNALHLLGVLEFQRGELTLSESLITKALSIDRSQAAAHTNLGNTLHALGELSKAITCYDRAIVTSPNYQAAYLNRGNALQDAGRLAEALSSYERALTIDPTNADAHNNRGNVLLDLGRMSDALESFSQAVALRPNYIDAQVNKASTLRMLGSHHEALDCIQNALTLAPTNPFALNNQGNILRDLGDFKGAIQSYNDALREAPDLCDALLNMSYAYLACGDLRRGFELYEWRRKVPATSRLLPRFDQPPVTNIESIAGKTIFVHCEQGFGDTIQFCRYIDAVRAHGADVIFQVQSSLKRLMQSLVGPAGIVAEAEPLPFFDCYVPLLSLPFLTGTTLDSIPSPGRYLDSNREKREAWMQRLNSCRRPRIGLAWSGSNSLAPGPFRNIPLVELLPALIEGPEYVCLQNEILAADEETIHSRPDIRIVQDQLKDFEDTAALIDSLDLVISVDTAIAHLAGALLHPTLIILPFNNEWRWLRERNDSPWYPSLTLSRQTQLGVWAPVLKDIQKRILSLMNT
jgi:tetratricopeptide (TPR) repeat protein